MNPAQTVDDYLANLLDDSGAAPAWHEPMPAPEAEPVQAPAAIVPPPRPAPVHATPLRAMPQRAAGIAPPAADPHRRSGERTTRWLQMHVDGQDYAVELLKVQEVVRPPVVLPLRGVAAEVLGVMNLRGQILPVVDLSVWLGGEPGATTAATRIVVLEDAGESIGLRVASVESVVTIADSAIESPAGVGHDHDAFRGVCRLGGAPVVLLDANALLR